MPVQVFLGGACGTTSWRADVAIPLLRDAGVTFYNPQLADGEWTPAHQYAEMEARSAADVWLFVVNEATCGVASVAECAYRIGESGKLALALIDLPENAVLHGRTLAPREIDDINRGRVFLRAMAEKHGVEVFATVADATAFAIHLARQAASELSLDKLAAVLRRVSVPGYSFIPEAIAGHLSVRISKAECNHQSGAREPMLGRRWLIERQATPDEVVRTLLKAALTWEEHELRERFRFDDRLIFDPHFELPADGVSSHS